MSNVSSATSQCSSFWNVAKKAAKPAAIAGAIGTGLYSFGLIPTAIGTAAATGSYFTGKAVVEEITGSDFWKRFKKQEVNITPEMARALLALAKAKEELAKREEELAKLKYNLRNDWAAVTKVNRELNKALYPSWRERASRVIFDKEPKPFSMSPKLLADIKKIVPKPAGRLRSSRKLNEGNLKEQLIQAVIAERRQKPFFNPVAYVEQEVSKLDISQAEKERVIKATMQEITKLKAEKII